MSGTRTESKPSEQLLDLFVYAPVGIALEAVDNLPKYVERGKSQVTIGRFLARTVARRGTKTVESFAERLAHEAGQVVVDWFGIDLSPEPIEVDAEVAAPTEPEPGADADLPIAEYDSQAAAQIVKLLPQLDDDELSAVERYEAAGRGRVTILRKIALLRDAA